MIFLRLDTFEKSIKIVKNFQSLFGKLLDGKDLLLFDFLTESLMDQFGLIFLGSKKLQYLFEFPFILIIKLFKLLDLTLCLIQLVFKTNQVLNFLYQTLMFLGIVGLDMD
jgi:hypothetical protein